MMITAGIDIGSCAVKSLLLKHGETTNEIVAQRCDRLRHRDVRAVVRESYDTALEAARLQADDVSYVATTGEGELVDFRTGHFYGMTAHARGGLEMVEGAGAVLDVGALHARAIVIDERGKVMRYRMTSQCASGSGQFLENIARYLGVALEEIGPLSLQADAPEKCSSICAVLAETDVINMVSRGIPIPNILKGIHISMAGRFVKLLQAVKAQGIVALTGGLSADVGLAAALAEEAARSKVSLQFMSSPDAVYAGALGSALWGRFRLDKLQAMGAGGFAEPGYAGSPT
jgi:benzoyl-CoA reductase subunit D